MSGPFACRADRRRDDTRPARLLLALGVALSLAVVGQAEPPAPDDEPRDPTPGIRLEISTSGASAPAVDRIVEELGGDWGLGSPDPRIAADGFEARWSGSLHVQAPGAHRFSARTDGTVRLRVAGRSVLQGNGPRVDGGPIELPAGLIPIVLEYRHGAGAARVAIDWEGPGFALEPLPSRLVYREGDSDAPVDRFEAGRRLADRLGCANCHAVLDLPRHPNLGPPLADAGRAIAPAWLGAWLTDPAKVRPRSRMPAVGAGLSPADVADLAAHLRAVAVPAPAASNEIKMALNVAEPAQGRLLFRSLGCLACHTRGEPIEGARTGPDLAGLERKRGVAWVASFLEHPRKGSGASRHRPDFRLEADEAAHLAAYLVGSPDTSAPAEDAPAGTSGDPARGRTLAGRARCASCHAIPGARPEPERLPLARGSRPDAGCLSDAPRLFVPRYDLTQVERRALRAFVAGLPERPARSAPSTLADDTVRRLNCLGCHARDGRGGEDLGARVARHLADDPALGGLKGTLTPPNLSAVGDKLRPEYLALAVLGKAPSARPWLSVRMPSFRFEPGEAEAVVAAFRTRDGRGLEVASDSDNVKAVVSRNRLERGASLIGQRGFGCLSCHAFAGRTPPGGEPETMGPDLTLAHRRMTSRYFERWLANPQRIIPGTPMPQFVKPAATSSGSLAEQLAAIWDLLGSPRAAEFAASGTRDVLRRQGDRALVVRDMVLLPGAPGTEYTPRGVAVGLRNEHSLLFDADRPGWLAWWEGGFVSRTKSGRLWEWHPEGHRLWTADDRPAPVAFLAPGGILVPPREERERFGSFLELAFEADGVVLTYRLNGPDASPVDVVERVRPIPGGWERDVAVSGVPAPYGAALALPRKRNWTAGTSRVRLEIDGAAGPSTGPPASPFAPLSPRGGGSFHARCRYVAERGAGGERE